MNIIEEDKEKMKGKLILILNDEGHLSNMAFLKDGFGKGELERFLHTCLDRLLNEKNKAEKAEHELKAK